MQEQSCSSASVWWCAQSRVCVPAVVVVVVYCWCRQLDSAVRAVSDPRSATYGQYLSLEAIAARYAPDQVRVRECCCLCMLQRCARRMPFRRTLPLRSPYPLPLYFRKIA